MVLAWWLVGRNSVPDSSELLVQVKLLNHLTTVRYTIQKVVTLEEQTQLIGSERILLILQAQVEAGVDLQRLGPKDVQQRPDGVTLIRLPPARLLNLYVDEKQTRVWDRSKTWWTPWIPFNPDLEKQARLQGLEAARQTALDMGILKQADRSATEAIQSLL
ncbi:MAG: DUF4230 domain-containing protein, partial [Bryobacteraceae bacterium]|nr:DUF4230 domain-containing protein [Bryobacteraceae bacterium]